MQDMLKPRGETSVPTIELVAVTKYYGETLALQDINLEIDSGEFLVLLGPSGCGKSTILRIIAGLVDATDGEVYINNRLANYVVPKERDVAMVFQNYALYPHMTVERNINFPLRMNRVSKDEIRERVLNVSQLLEINELLDRYPEQLSGGQRQRVALGRALIRDPIAFLLDEPLSNLDALLRVQMREELLKLHRKIGRTTVYVTHDQVEAMTMADRIVVLKLGIIQQVAKPWELYERPANIFVATFVGSPQMNVNLGVTERRNGSLKFNGPFQVDIGDRFAPMDGGVEASLGIRPEDIALVNDSEPDSIPGKLVLVEPIGSDIYLTIEVTPDTSFKVRVPASRRFQEGEHLNLQIPKNDLHLFDAEGLRISPKEERETSVSVS